VVFLSRGAFRPHEPGQIEAEDLASPASNISAAAAA